MCDIRVSTEDFLGGSFMKPTPFGGVGMVEVLFVFEPVKVILMFVVLCHVVTTLTSRKSRIVTKR